ncbi:rhodanese-like domain-containing protein [Dietzia sp.]|uniref:rhodanese-like domain-containing protein n=1 Tax=Dietzia sp. TaxID=1871616 RepID=UPI002FD8EF93
MSASIETASPQETWEALASDPDAVLIDVRTTAEWAWVGVPDTSAIGRPVVYAEWLDVHGEQNERFLAELDEAGVGPRSKAYFLCRSGARSQSAAEAAAGKVASAVNVSGGFEGPLDSEGHRGAQAGWKVAGLPWRQG